MAEHSVFGGAAPPWEPTTALDDPVALGSAFYSVAQTWWAVGARLRVPVGDSGLFPASVTLELRFAPTFSLVDLSTTPAASGVATVADGWITAMWAPQPFAPGTAAWVTLSAGSTTYPFVPVGTVGLGPVQATDASDLYLAEAGTSIPAEQPRSAFRYGAGATQLSQAWYGVDILVSDGAVEGDVALAATGVLSSTGEVNAAGDVSLAASGALAATGGVSATESATLAATGSLSATGAVQSASSVNLVAVAVLTAHGLVLGGGVGGCWEMGIDAPDWELSIDAPTWKLGIDAPTWTLEFEC